MTLSLTPTERIALEFIKAGKEPSSAALEAIMQRRWARKVKGAVEITEAGEKLAEDTEAPVHAILLLSYDEGTP